MFPFIHSANEKEGVKVIHGIKPPEVKENIKEEEKVSEWDSPGELKEEPLPAEIVPPTPKEDSKRESTSQTKPAPKKEPTIEVSKTKEEEEEEEEEEEGYFDEELNQDGMNGENVNDYNVKNTFIEQQHRIIKRFCLNAKIPVADGAKFHQMISQ